MNLYFLVSIAEDGSASLNSEEQFLPSTFLNVSNFNNIEFNDPHLLPDLSWLGRPDLGFWLGIQEEKPIANFYQKIEKKITINQKDKTVTISYFTVNLTEQEIDIKKKNIKTIYSPVRDSYLRLTDFTQFSDAPVSEDEKFAFSIFRKELRNLFDIEDYSKLAWPTMPTLKNSSIPPMPNLVL